jgi:hypothetical protein
LNNDPADENVDQRDTDDIALFEFVPKPVGRIFAHIGSLLTTIHSNGGKLNGFTGVMMVSPIQLVICFQFSGWEGIMGSEWLWASGEYSVCITYTLIVPLRMLSTPCMKGLI